MTKLSRIVFGLLCVHCLTVVTFAAGFGPAQPILQRFHNIKLVSSTVPSNGDVNPYGVAQVQRSIGDLQEGSILVSSGTPPGSGVLFGLTFDLGRGIFFVDDATNELNVLQP